MEYISPLATGVVVIFLWGLVWRSSNKRQETLEEKLEQRVNKETCAIIHGGVNKDLKEIMRRLEKLNQTSTNIQMAIAKMNGD